MVQPWSPTAKTQKRNPWQSMLVLALAAFFVAHFTLLSPSNLEEDFNGVRVIHPRDLLNFLKNETAPLAQSVPLDVPPSYSIRNMDFYSTDQNEPSFRMIARKSNLYQEQQLTHSRDARLELPDGTTLEAKEMAMWQDQDVTHLYGDVTVRFKDGLTVKTDYAEVLSRPQLRVQVPLTQRVVGTDTEPALRFESMGMTYSEADQGEIRLLSQVQVWIQGSPSTQVRSDFALYLPPLNRIQFQMMEGQPLARQFAKVTQPDLTILSRSIETQLFGSKIPKSQQRGGQIETITALGDVQIDDRHDPQHPAQGTSGKGVFTPEQNEILLTDFPQVYQDGDTITGDQILFNRERDIIEVKQSNAIYQRNNTNSGRSPKP